MTARGDRHAQLRKRALAQLAAHPEPDLDGADGQRLLHELQVQRIELELQNEELQHARAEAEALLARYAELYEQAPVGYLTLDANAAIVQTNRVAADMFGQPRERLLGLRLAERIERMDRPAFNAFLQRLAGPDQTSLCELTLQRDDHQLRIVQIDGRRSADGREWWITLSDTTSQRLSTSALLRSETRLRRAYRRLAQAQESERLRLTEQLHDRVGRNLTALGLSLTLLEEELADQLGPVQRERLSDSQSMLRETVTDVRDVMSELYPPMLQDFGLFAALRWWGGELGKRSGIPIRIEQNEPAPRQSFEIESALFRIAQEALANAVRHARPRQVGVELRHGGRTLRLAITDDGCGFDVEQLADDERGSWGLMLMRERALAIGAQLQIESTAGVGTRVQIDTEAAR